MSKKKIRIVIGDSDYFIINILKRKLEASGFQVFAGRTADQLLKLVLDHEPDIVLMELKLPGSDGFSLIRTMSKHGILMQAPIVVHSELNRKEAIVQAIRCGAVNYIVKPASFRTILEKLSSELKKVGIDVAHAKQSETAGHGTSVLSKDEFVKLAQADKLKYVVTRAEQLQALPQAVHQALKLANDPKTSAGKLAKVIESDTAITAVILRKSNTVVFGKSEPIIDVKDAIVRLGFRQAVGLVSAMSVVKSFADEEQSLGFNRLEFWEHSLATAIIAYSLAQKSGACDSSDAFVGGLMHDLGKIIFDQCIPVDFERCIEKAHREVKSLSVASQELFGFSHVELGKHVLKKWKLPDYLIRIVEETHKTHDYASEPESDWVRVGRFVQSANILAKAFGFGTASNQVIEELNNDMAAFLRLSTDLGFVFRKHINMELGAFKNFLAMDTSHRVDLYDSSFGIPRIFLFDSSSPQVNTLGLFLEFCGFIVEMHSDLETALKKVVESPDASLLLIRGSKSEDVSVMADTLSDLDEEIPILFASDRFQLSEWKKYNTRKHTELLEMPIACGELIRVISILCEGA